MIEDLFVPDAPTGDNSNRIANTRFVLANAGGTGFAQIAGLSVVGNASTVTATAAAITGTADQLLAVNHAATTVLFTSVSSFIDNAVGSTQNVMLFRNAATWIATTVSGYIDTAVGSTQGAVLYRNSASWVTLGPGTAGQLLQTQGVNANPQWTTAPTGAGAMTLVNTLSPSGVTFINDTTSLTSTYSSYLVLIDALTPNTTNAQLMMRVATSGVNFLAVNYTSSTFGSSVTITSSATAMAITGLSLASTVGQGYSGAIRIYNPSAANHFAWVRGDGVLFDNGAGNTIAAWHFGKIAVSSPITGLQFLFSNATFQIATGTIKIYGLT